MDPQRWQGYPRPLKVTAAVARRQRVLASTLPAGTKRALRQAFTGQPLPVAAPVLATWQLWGTKPSVQGRPWMAAGLPLVMALLTLVFLAASYVAQPGRLRSR